VHTKKNNNLTKNVKLENSMLSTSLGRLRLVSFVEGVSYLLLLFVGMPLKYGLEIREVNYVLGMGHGVLTMIFVLLLFVAFADKCISFVDAIKVFAASLVPFGAFWAEKQFKNWIQEQGQETKNPQPE
jgi:integral membrane protein